MITTVASSGLRRPDSFTSLHIRGGLSGNVFKAETGQTLTKSGSPTTAATGKFTSGPLGITVGGGNILTIVDSAAFTFGSNDFTIELWVKRNSTGSVMYICGQCDSTGSNATTSVAIKFNANNTLSGTICSGETAYMATTVTAPTDTDLFHHIGLTRSGNMLALYYDGVVSATASVTGVSVNNSSNNFSIGRLGEYTWDGLNGIVQEFKITLGVAHVIPNRLTRRF